MSRKEKDVVSNVVSIWNNEPIKQVQGSRGAEKRISKMIKNGQLRNKQYLLIYWDDENLNFSCSPDVTMGALLWKLERVKKEVLGD